jgi:putative ABC transport system permease protein
VKVLNQLAAVTLMGLRTIPQRLSLSLVIVVGMACVVAVTISIMSLSISLFRSVNSTARPDEAMVLSKGAQFEPASSIPRDSLVAISDAPGIKKGADGKPIVSAQFFTFIPVNRKSDGVNTYVGINGVGPNFFVIHPEIRLVAGRMFVPGRRELVVGSKLHVVHFDPGDHIRLPGGDWTVTGIYDGSDDIFESQTLADTETVISAMRTNVFRSVWVQLQRPDLYQQFKRTLETNPALSVDVKSAAEFWDSVATNNTRLFRMIAYVVGSIMGIGAAFAALNTMLTIVGTRSIEIATLRAIGFDGRVVVVSVLMEALTLAAAGAVIGAAAAWLVYNGKSHALGAQAISLAVTPGLIAYGVAYACLLGLIGGSIPAVRAAAMPVTSALRAT